MKKGLFFGLILAGIAAVGAAIYKSSKKKQCDCEEFDEEYDDCCCCDDDCCDEVCEIPSEKAEDQGVVNDACECDSDEEDPTADTL